MMHNAVMMNVVILDDYQDAVRKLPCASKLDAFHAKVYTNTIKGVGQLSVRLREADIIVLIRARTSISRQLIEKLPRLKLIALGLVCHGHQLHRIPLGVAPFSQRLVQRDALTGCDGDGSGDGVQYQGMAVGCGILAAAALRDRKRVV